MDKMAAEDIDDCSLSVDTRFCGTRNEPDLKGSISQITEENFSSQQLTRGFLKGMCGELYSFYLDMEKLTGKRRTKLVDSGNGVRKNTIVQYYLEQTFKMPISIPENLEEVLSERQFLQKKQKEFWSWGHIVLLLDQLSQDHSLLRSLLWK